MPKVWNVDLLVKEALILHKKPLTLETQTCR